MHSIRPRPICRARNTFSPSIALWQHFIAPSQRLLQRPSTSSLTTEAAQSCDDGRVSPNREEPRVNRVRRITSSDRWGPDNTKRSQPAGLHGKGQKRSANPGFRGEVGQDVSKLLAKAYEAYDLAQDYQGVVVQPVSTPRVKDDTYPWVIPDWRNMQSGEER